MKFEELLHKTYFKHKRWIEQNEHQGFDIYDGLNLVNSKFLLHNKYSNFFLTQFFKYFPFNIRPLLGMPKTKMPKAIGLYLNAYSALAQYFTQNNMLSELEECEGIIEDFKNWLIENQVDGFSGAAWNFGFNYKFMFETPTVVITSIIARGFFAEYQRIGCEKSKQILLDIAEFILNDLPITETKDGICFSYTPPKKDCCFNASMLAAETLSYVYSITNEARLQEYIRKATNFTLAYQKPEGFWNYDVDLATRKEKPQVDFHQGYVLESLAAVLRYSGTDNVHYCTSMKRGIDFYVKRQFSDEGRSLWRYPIEWPTDMHYQSQGIITLLKLKEWHPEYVEFANKIAKWSIENMFDSGGYFYYQNHRGLKNKIPYMRWVQAWMFLAFSYLITEK